jgi:hypothetical protein
VYHTSVLTFQINVIPSSWECPILDQFSSHVNKYQPSWTRRKYCLLIRRKSNLLCGVEIQISSVNLSVLTIDCSISIILLFNKLNQTHLLFLLTKFFVLRGKSQEAITSVVLLKHVVSIKRYITTNTTMLQHCTVSTTVYHFTLTPVYCKHYSIVYHTRIDPQACPTRLADLTDRNCILYVIW